MVLRAVVAVVGPRVAVPAGKAERVAFGGEAEADDARGVLNEE